MLITIESGHFLVTAYPAGGRMKAMISLCAPGAVAAGDAELIGEMARQMRLTAGWLRAIEESMDKESMGTESADKEERKAG